MAARGRGPECRPFRLAAHTEVGLLASEVSDFKTNLLPIPITAVAIFEQKSERQTPAAVSDSAKVLIKARKSVKVRARITRSMI
jgi:hypothetical protein